MNKILTVAALLFVLCIKTTFAGWDFVWSDEFDYKGLPDDAKWGYDVGGHGWGNQELQYYTEKRLENARVDDSVLIITAIKEPYEGMNYTSARLITRNKADWLYGRVEVAAKLPQGTGVWPAIWMLPTDWEYGQWPASGELDIMENVGFDPYRVHFNIHTEAYNHSIGTNKGNSTTLDDPHTTFNVYALEWFEDHIDFFANDDTIFTFENENNTFREWPFDKRFHLLLNIAVGGSWGGQQGVDDAIFPQEFIIDYVRVYQYNDVPVIADSAHKPGNFSCIRTNRELTVYSIRKSVTIEMYTLDGKTLWNRNLPVYNNHAGCRLPKISGSCIVRIKNGTDTAIKRIVFVP